MRILREGLDQGHMVYMSIILSERKTCERVMEKYGGDREDVVGFPIFYLSPIGLGRSSTDQQLC